MENRGGGGGSPIFAYNNIIIITINTLCTLQPSITDSGCRRTIVAAAASAGGSVVAAGAAAGRRQVRDAPASTRLISSAPVRPSLWASGPVAATGCSVAVAETTGCCRTGTPCPSASGIPRGSSAETTRKSMNKRKGMGSCCAFGAVILDSSATRIRIGNVTEF